MTASACEFVGAKTFEGLTGHPVMIGSTQIDADGSASHIAATRDADLMVIAPATAGLIARLAAGMCDDAVTLAAVACRAPKLCCPAMNDAMWESAVVQRNVATLLDLGFHLAGPVVGHLAEGYDAIGRMLDPEAIQAAIDALL
jgi:phosphopantothenoylcysteine decarboxylase/phosphopantothenate--cysteine ligase